MPKIFLSYRREDAAPYAGRLHDRLAARFGRDRIFMDIDDIALGEDFGEVIRARVSSSEILIALIGPAWLDAADSEGARRIDRSDDFVHLEIVHALQNGIRVIPALVGGAKMPSSAELPEPLQPLVRRQAIEVTNARFHSDVDRLIESIEPGGAPVERSDFRLRTPTLIAGAAAVLALAGVGGRTLFHKSDVPAALTAAPLVLIDAGSVPIGSAEPSTSAPQPSATSPSTRPIARSAPQSIEIGRPTNVNCSGTISQRVYFEVDNPALAPGAPPVVDRIVDIMRACPSLKLAVAGHADGPEHDPLPLSQARAKSVVMYMVSQGIAQSRMSPEAYGNDRPILRNDAGKPVGVNMRVDFRVTQH
jgi:outer membrane protein OmpA-like peptidoglycan-associated protein